MGDVTGSILLKKSKIAKPQKILRMNVSDLSRSKALRITIKEQPQGNLGLLGWESSRAQDTRRLSTSKTAGRSSRPA
jgi:hypothetical protein